MDSICVRCRAAGEKLYLKGDKCLSPSCPFTRRPYPPGPSGPGKQKKGVRQVSDFARQLRGKQKIKKTYLMRERQLRRFFEVANRRQGPTGEQLLGILESRLDSVVFAAKFRSSRAAARQAVSHHHVTVNGQTVSIPSFLVSPKDRVEVSSAPEDWSKAELPAWLEASKGGVTMSRQPLREEMPPFLDEQALVEYYGR